jgi:hypothetical protein
MLPSFLKDNNLLIKTREGCERLGTLSFSASTDILLQDLMLLGMGLLTNRLHPGRGVQFSCHFLQFSWNRFLLEEVLYLL